MTILKPACERLFRLYHKHCVSPDLDTLFNLLNALHSLNDKLNKSNKGNFYKIDEFIVLKALRNIFHHQEELVNKVRLIPVQELTPVSTDLLYLCLVPSVLVEASFEEIGKNFRDKEKIRIRSVLGWHGEVVNINPCIFNFVVKAYEKIKELKIELSGQEYLDFADSYNFETENGHSHLVTGFISCHVGNVNEVLQVAYANII